MTDRPTPAGQREKLIANAQDAVAEAPRNFRDPSVADVAMARGHVDVLADGTTVIAAPSRSRPIRLGRRVIATVRAVASEIAEPSSYWETPELVDSRSFENSTPEALVAADKLLAGMSAARKKRTN